MYKNKGGLTLSYLIIKLILFTDFYLFLQRLNHFNHIQPRCLDYVSFHIHLLIREGVMSVCLKSINNIDLRRKNDD